MPENTNKRHNLILENREHLSLSGVKDVYGFNEEIINAGTELGGIVIKGVNLHISKLDLDSGDVDIEGTINSLQYVNSKDKKSLVQRLFS